MGLGNEEAGRHKGLMENRKCQRIRQAFLIEKEVSSFFELGFRV